MRLVESIEEMRERLGPLAGTAGLVPTMGALHAGHGRLIEEARTGSGAVVVSIFVNPIQFNQSADFERYPRTLETDAAFCAEREVDYIFAPSREEMYPGDPAAFVDVTRVGDHMEGRFRPGHFRGVATVVLKLLEIVRPKRAYFGEKDAQQLAVVRRMVRDFNVPVEIVGVPTVREADGLALSSRNRRLSPEERRIAPRLHEALCAARARLEEGERDAGRIRQAALAVLACEPGFRVEYVEVADDEMQPVERVVGPVRVLAAAWLGETRLIDNVPWEWQTT